MNAIQLRLRIDEIIDRPRSARFLDSAYYDAINAAITLIVKDRVEAIRVKRNYGVQSSQRLRDELYTLIPTPATGALIGGDVPYPTDYFYYLLVYLTINNVQYFVRPTSFGEIGPLFKNPFKKPSAIKPYFNEYALGLKLYTGGASGIGNYELHYVAKPAIVSIGQTRDIINTIVALTNATVYYVYQDATYNATVTTGSGATVTSGQIIAAGETFTATGANLLTGAVIIGTKIVNCNLPDNIHEEICQRTASLLSENISDYNKYGAANKIVEEN